MEGGEPASWRRPREGIYETGGWLGTYSDAAAVPFPNQPSCLNVSKIRSTHLPNTIEMSRGSHVCALTDAQVLIKEMSTPSSGRSLINGRDAFRPIGNTGSVRLWREREHCLQGGLRLEGHLSGGNSPHSLALPIVSLARPSSIWRVRYIAVLSPLPACNL